MRRRCLGASALAVGLALSGGAWAHGGGHDRVPPVGPPVGPPGTPSPPALPPSSPYTVGDYWKWWEINREEVFLVRKPADSLARYDRKAPPPDPVPVLLSLVGYEGQFASLVKEVGIGRLKAVPNVGKVLEGILQDVKGQPRERAWAAYALGDLGVRAAVPALVKAL